MEGSTSPCPSMKLSCFDANIVLPPMNIWVQGIITDLYIVDEHHFILIDDGTGLLFASTVKLEWNGRVMEKGSYVFFQGALIIQDVGDEINFNNDGRLVKRFINIRSAGCVENVNMETFWLLSLLES